MTRNNRKGIIENLDLIFSKNKKQQNSNESENIDYRTLISLTVIFYKYYEEIREQFFSF